MRIKLKNTVRLLLRLVAKVHLLIRSQYERVYGALQFEGVGKCGDNLSVEGGGVIYEKNKISIGKHVFIGRNFFIRAAGGVTIGDYTHISRNVTIHTVNHNMNGKLLPYDREDVLKPVSIGKYVWIGMNVNILPGVTIGDGAIVGMGTTVSKNIAENEIVVGYGQRVVGSRSETETKALVQGECFLRNKKREYR